MATRCWHLGLGIWAILIRIGVEAADLPAIVNGSMSDGDAVPTGWTEIYTDSGHLKVARDGADFAEGPASLRLSAVGGAANGNVSQKLETAAGKTFIVKGKIKCSNVEYGAIVVFVQDKDWKQLAWIECAKSWKTQGWKEFSKLVNVPPDAGNVLLMVFMRGEGSVWADELEITGPGGDRPKRDASVKPMKRSEHSPQIVHVSAIARDILAVTVRSGEIEASRIVSYEKQPGDRITDKKSHGQAQESALVRDGTRIGWLAGPKRDMLCTFEKLTGDRLQTEFADDPGSYTITSNDDPGYATGVNPEAVFRKSKPADWEQPGRGFEMRHVLYLKMPRRFIQGKTYVLDFGPVNVAARTCDYVHNPAVIVSEAVHVNHVGFRPDETKVGFLSLWLGSGGESTYPKDQRFFVLSETASGLSEAIFTGQTTLAKAAHEPELMKQDINYNRTNVYRIDFSAVRKPGRYRICVEGIGCSRPFEIREDVWELAFRVSMLGFLRHRSGIKLGPPLTNYERPRCYHPDDGVQVRASRVPLMDTSMGLNVRDKDAFTELLKTRTEEVLREAWGGYMDAGDWDRRIQHLRATRLHLELLDLFPGYFTRLRLAVPEKDNGLPDLLDEALWNIDCYRRIQMADGGVRGGIEAASHPVEGETSWLESLPVMAYGPGIWASYIYAGAAARAAHVLRGIDPERGTQYGESALRAMTWAENEYSKWKQDRTVRKRPREIRDDRNLAALELYRLTGEKRWDGIFMEDTCLKDPECELFDYDDHVQRDAAFVYARMDNQPSDPVMKKTAVSAIAKEADRCLEYAGNNAFGIVSTHKSKPHHMGFYSSPGECIQLCRAHSLTGDRRYRVGAVLGTQYCLGANPMNMTFTTGLGHDWPRHPLHLDSRRTGRPAPAGITVYGQFDLVSDMHVGGDWFNWPIKWYLDKECEPSAWSWPSTEAYYDISMWPAVCEYTIEQTLGPTCYVWGYLAGSRY